MDISILVKIALFVVVVLMAVGISVFVYFMIDIIKCDRIIDLMESKDPVERERGRTLYMEKFGEIDEDIENTDKESANVEKQ